MCFQDGRTAADFAHDHQQIKVERLLLNRGASLFAERMEKKEAERMRNSQVPESDDQITRLQGQLALSEAALHSEQLRVRQLELDLQDSDDQLKQARAFNQSSLTQLQSELKQCQVAEQTLQHQLQAQRADFEANLSLAQFEMDSLRSTLAERQQLFERVESTLRLERANLAGAQMRARELESDLKRAEQQRVAVEVAMAAQAETHRVELKRREENSSKIPSSVGLAMSTYVCFFVGHSKFLQ
jgi:chromosome segregation ATPase